jgi:hypothetical protein
MATSRTVLGACHLNAREPGRMLGKLWPTSMNRHFLSRATLAKYLSSICKVPDLG